MRHSTAIRIKIQITARLLVDRLAFSGSVLNQSRHIATIVPTHPHSPPTSRTNRSPQLPLNHLQHIIPFQHHPRQLPLNLPLQRRRPDFRRHLFRPHQKIQISPPVPQLKPLRIGHHHNRRIIIPPLPAAKNPEQLALRHRKLSRLLRQQRIQNLKLRLDRHPRRHRRPRPAINTKTRH